MIIKNLDTKWSTKFHYTLLYDFYFGSDGKNRLNFIKIFVNSLSSFYEINESSDPIEIQMMKHEAWFYFYSCKNDTESAGSHIQKYFELKHVLSGNHTDS